MKMGNVPYVLQDEQYFSKWGEDLDPPAPFTGRGDCSTEKEGIENDKSMIRRETAWIGWVKFVG